MSLSEIIKQMDETEEDIELDFTDIDIMLLKKSLKRLGKPRERRELAVT